MKSTYLFICLFILITTFGLISVMVKKNTKNKFKSGEDKEGENNSPCHLGYSCGKK